MKELTTLNYLTENPMKYIDLLILIQLKDIAIYFSRRKCKNTMGQMFFIEAAFLKKALLAWFDKKN